MHSNLYDTCNIISKLEAIFFLQTKPRIHQTPSIHGGLFRGTIWRTQSPPNIVHTLIICDDFFSYQIRRYSLTHQRRKKYLLDYKISKSIPFIVKYKFFLHESTHFFHVTSTFSVLSIIYILLCVAILMKFSDLC